MAYLPVPANTTFEVDTTGWSADISSISRSTSNFYKGVASLFVDLSGVGGGTFVTTEVAAAPNTLYTLSFWAYTLVTGTLRLGWNEYDGAHGFLTSRQESVTLTPGEWGLASCDQTTGATVAFVQALIAKPIDENQDFYIDDVNDPVPLSMGAADNPPVGILGVGAGW